MISTPKKPRILVVANQKGGVGKTTTAINLGTALAAVGEPTLVIDIDPQGNASTGLGIPRSARKLTTYDVLMGEAKLADAIVPTRIPKLSIVPATVDLSGAELELIDRERRNFILKDALEEYSAHGGSEFSYVLIDCPPSLTLLTINAMCAADAVMVKLEPAWTLAVPAGLEPCQISHTDLATYDLLSAPLPWARAAGRAAPIRC